MEVKFTCFKFKNAFGSENNNVIKKKQFSIYSYFDL